MSKLQGALEMPGLNNPFIGQLEKRQEGVKGQEGEIEWLIVTQHVSSSD